MTSLNSPEPALPHDETLPSDDDEQLLPNEGSVPPDLERLPPLKRLEVSLPPELNEDLYREMHRDLRQMTGDQLRTHWEQFGQREGRQSHPLKNRAAFVGLVPADVDALEIGPFHDPLLTGPRVRYFDILDRQALIARARKIGYPTERIPEIDFVSPGGDLSIVDEKFDVVLSSHVIEHQPDLIRHLRTVERLLRPGGFYFLLIPDKQYCFDHFIPESSVAEIISAHHAGRRIHTLRSQIEHAALRTHNNSKRHWRGDHGTLSEVKERIMSAVAAYQKSPDAYVDVHAWYFTPRTFCDCMKLLRELDYMSMEVSRIYPTLRAANEFWVVLQASSR